ncbi:MAG: DUF3536 domain-containing protein [Candidatus Omnitrophica bacterium]|nr:DUF3536 domain-containing protein [Candidatus Omnitrophota bacterium]
MNRYVCVHGHFYQPPRENPWLEEIEIQDSAYPYHDWNERIMIECYAPNAASRILDHEHKIINIVNNYARMSFNFGPTLLSWMQRKMPHAYAMILEADRESRKKYSGHGSALAQVYNHMIMPLADSRDKRTQIIWGIRDFEYRFQRRPEGMWLAETAVDLETLDLMAEQGIAFTILSPYQALAVRQLEAKEWVDSRGGKIDPKMPYRCGLPSGKSMAIFFYDGPISRDIAFGGLLNNGEGFARRLMEGFTGEAVPQLMHIATDGETYGHHHGYGEMALSYCMNFLEEKGLARLTVYGEYLERFPPTHEVKIVENSSWSCVHGVERWRSDCGCHTGGRQGWTQAWRQPLRETLDWLRDELAHLFEKEMCAAGMTAWPARDRYIDVALNRNEQTVAAFFAEHAGGIIFLPEQKVRLLKLLEMQRQAMLMYTSCGWFFNEVSGIETVQILHYACRALQLAREISGKDLEPELISRLQAAKSNIDAFGTAAEVYRRLVQPAALDLRRVAAHYAISSLFTDYDEESSLYCYTVKRHRCDRLELGKQNAVLGRISVCANITGEAQDVSFAIFHFGDHNLIGGVRESLPDDVFSAMEEKIRAVFQRSDITAITALIDEYFGNHKYSFWSLFRDEQRAVLHKILTSTMEEIEQSFRQINEHHYPVLRVMKSAGLPLPKIFSTTLGFIHNTDLLRSLESSEIDVERLRALVEAVREWPLEIDRQMIGFVAGRWFNECMEAFVQNPDRNELLQLMEQMFIVLEPLGLPLRLWSVQNAYFDLSRHIYPAKQWRAEKHADAFAAEWVETFESLSRFLRIRTA